jgi:hypothetical protein
MKYVISGKTDNYELYLKNNGYSTGKQAIHARKESHINSITEDDTIVLLNGWWARSWAKSVIRDIMKAYPAITFEYLDGTFGKNERNDLKSENISNRFDILDL